MAKINLLDQSNFLILCMKFTAVILLVLPLGVMGQKTDTLSEVVDSGTSRPSRIRENPVAITAVPAKAIDRTVSSNIIDVLAQHTPGLHSVKTGPNISKPFIRGLGYNRVLTMYDGLRQEGQL